LKTNRIYGPPGTGKTTYLLNVVEELLARGATPERIGYTTFTKAGALEALDRACVKFAKAPESFPFFKTVHALCYKAGTQRKVLGYDDYKKISENLGMPITYASNSQDGIVSATYRGDYIMQIYQLSRVKMQDVTTVFNSMPAFMDVSLPEIANFIEHYEEYKRFHKKQDFTDMLSDFVLNNRPLDVDYLIIDEAQDIKPLEWAALDVMGANAAEIWLGGDDDQCIHSWAGSSVDELLERRVDDDIVLTKSYRVPQAVHALANETIKKVSVRADKEYRPKDAEGSVQWIDDVYDLNIGDGSWFFLARNKTFLQQYEQFCNNSSLLYNNPTSRSNKMADMCKVICNWETLISGGLIFGSEAKRIYKHLKNRERVDHGAKKLIDSFLDDEELIDIQRLKNEFGLLWSQSWETAFINLSLEEKERLEAIEAKYGFDKAPDITINTIHGSKGKEAENVVLMLDMTRKTFQAYQEQPDNEHRVFYVGMTRAIENLYIIHPSTNMSYAVY